MTMINAAIAATRFGMGAQSEEISQIGGDARGWLEQQLQNIDAARLSSINLRSSKDIGEEIIGALREQRRMRFERRSDNELAAKRKNARRSMAMVLISETAARNTHAVETSSSFLERWVRFWSNHFSVGFRKIETLGLVGAFEREAIRHNAFRTFEDLLKSSTFHPTMILYLDNHKSVGPSTRVARRRGIGLNENLARELLELHTLGVNGGYSQEDVTSFAKALTGWTIGSPQLRRGRFGEVLFEKNLHEPGRHTILGKTYADDGGDQAMRVLADLARHPSTARHIAIKLSRHFVSDDPPASAIDRLERTFIATGGDLRELARAVIQLDEAWQTDAQKFKTPEELLISSARALGGYAVFGGAKDLRKIYESLGQQPFGAPSPEGWPDTAADWTGPDAIKKRLEWANRAGQRGQSRINAAAFLDNALGPLVSDATRNAISRAESNAQGLTLALMSPEFQRR